MPEAGVHVAEFQLNPSPKSEFHFVSPYLNPGPTVCSACTVLSTNAMSACTHRKTHVSVRVPTSLASARLR